MQVLRSFLASFEVISCMYSSACAGLMHWSAILQRAASTGDLVSVSSTQSAFLESLYLNIPRLLKATWLAFWCAAQLRPVSASRIEDLLFSALYDSD